MLGGAIAPHHQKHLHNQPGRIDEPIEQHRRQGIGQISQRPIEGQVVPDEQLRRKRPQHVEERQAGGGGECGG